MSIECDLDVKISHRYAAFKPVTSMEQFYAHDQDSTTRDMQIDG